MPGNTGGRGGDDSWEELEDSDFGDELTKAVAQGSALMRLPMTGERLGGQDGSRFEILEPLGCGAMGQVFRAVDAKLGRVVALKFLLPRLFLDKERLVSRLLGEAYANAPLAHANIVRLFDVSEWAGGRCEPPIPFLVMECLEGLVLSEVLRREQRMDPPRALDILGGIVAGLAHAQEHRVIHRDLKPGNIFLSRQGEVKLLDFGLAWILEEGEPGVLDLPQAGTPAYMAPEQWRGDKQDQRTDIWAAGIVLYELLTGVLPYADATSLPELRALILSEEPVPPVHAHRPELPQEFTSLLDNMLHKNPARRYSTAQELGKDLRELIEELGYQSQTPRPKAAERRQVTLVSCQLTRLADLATGPDDKALGELEEAFHQRCAELVQQRRDSIALHLGHEVLACFGYPVAREEDSEHAVRVGLMLAREVPAFIQRKLPGLPPGVLAVRVGIHTDQVTLDERPREQGGLQLRGEAPKIAHWLAAQAEPHAVVVSETTGALVRGTFETEMLGHRSYQGLSGSRPLVLHRVLHERPATFRFERALTAGRELTPLVGREEELHRLLACWHEARHGRGAFVLVRGEAGIGKSRLIQELHQRVSQEPCIHFQSQCWPQSSTSAFQPVFQVLRRFSSSPEVPSGEPRLSSEHASLLLQLLSMLFSEGSPSSRHSPERHKAHTFKAFAALLAGAARKHPVLGVVEDLHWADPSTLELLGYLLKRMEKERVLLILSARPDFHATWAQHPRVHRLTLERLSPERTATLVRESAHGQELSPELVQQLVARTDGIPLFVEELTRMVLEQDTFSTIPITLHELLRARLDQLPLRQTELAQSCAALGRGFSHALVAALHRNNPSLRRDLEGLMVAGVLQPWEEGNEAGYQFRHALLQEAALQSLPLGSRRQLHQHITQALLEVYPEVAETQPELLAHHHAEAGEYAPAVHYWEQAGQRACLRSAHQEAVSHYQQALRVLQLMPETPQRLARELRLRGALGTPLAQLRGYQSEEVERTYSRVDTLLRDMGDALPRVRLPYFGLFSYFFSRAEYARAHELAEQLVSLGRCRQDRKLLALGHRMMAADFFIWGHFSDALEHVEWTLEYSELPLEEQRVLSEEQGLNPRATALALGAMVQSIRARKAEAYRYSQEALELARRIGHPHTCASVLTYLGVACQLRDEVWCALEWSNEAIELSSEHGFRAWRLWSTMIRIWALSARGVMSAPEIMRRAIAGWEESGILAGRQHHALGLLAELHLKLGQLREVLAVTTTALERARISDEHFYEAELHRLQGEALRALGREPEARDCFLRALVLARQQGASAFEQRALEALGSLPPVQPPV